MRILIISVSLIVHAGFFTTGLHAAGDDITIKGSTTILPIVQIASELFMERHPEITISVQGGGSGVGIASIIDGTCDIATSSRSIKDEERHRASSRGVDVKETVIAMDGIAVIVHPSNIKNFLTRDQIKAIYIGHISNWADIGGSDTKIVVISRDSSSGTFEAFEHLALSGARVRADALTTASNQAVNMTVAQTPGAIGYMGLGYLSKKVKAVAVDGVKCTRDTILSGQYPLARPLFIYTNGEPEGSVKKFIEYILGDDGQDLIEEEGFVRLRDR
ncbi:MAG: phosphate ABC transporter substrate-binding protein [Desulfomonilia bacterium]